MTTDSRTTKTYRRTLARAVRQSIATYLLMLLPHIRQANDNADERALQALRTAKFHLAVLIDAEERAQGK